MKINNLPPNLYHITTTERLAKIKKDKRLKAMPDTLTNGKVKGVFTFDLENFGTQWTKDNRMNLARLILDYIARGKEIVALRIPLKNIPEEQQSRIKTRDVNKVIDWKFGEYTPGNNYEVDILGQHPDKLEQNLRSKRAVEHILPSDIEIEKIDTLGTANYNSKTSLQDVILGLFKGQPEEKDIKKIFHIDL